MRYSSLPPLLACARRRRPGAGARGGRRSRSRPSGPSCARRTAAATAAATVGPARLVRDLAAGARGARRGARLISSTRPGRSVNGLAVGRAARSSTSSSAATRSSESKNDASGSASDHAGDVRRDRRQHVVAREQHALAPGRTGRGGRWCGRACEHADPLAPGELHAVGVGDTRATACGDAEPARARRSALRSISAQALRRRAARCAAPRRRSPNGVGDAVDRAATPSSASSASQSAPRARRRRRRRVAPACGRASCVIDARAPLSSASRPAPPKWSGWEWVTIDGVDARASGSRRPRAARSSDLHDASPGRPGSTMAKPRSSSRA